MRVVCFSFCFATWTFLLFSGSAYFEDSALWLWMALNGSRAPCSRKQGFKGPPPFVFQKVVYGKEPPSPYDLGKRHRHLPCLPTRQGQSRALKSSPFTWSVVP